MSLFPDAPLFHFFLIGLLSKIKITLCFFNKKFLYPPRKRYILDLGRKEPPECHKGEMELSRLESVTAQ